MLIHKGFIIGWFQGKMEFGPRALGNRSILASPLNSEIKDIINKKIKFREEFRPFAASILAEYASEFFYIEDSGEFLYPYMLASVRAKPEKVNIIPAVLHVDETSRIQILRKDENPIFWSLVNEYYKLSNVPLVLNTSFNVKGEPIVCNPEDAIHTFLNSHLDFLILENFMLSKKETFYNEV